MTREKRNPVRGAYASFDCPGEMGGVEAINSGLLENFWYIVFLQSIYCVGFRTIFGKNPLLDSRHKLVSIISAFLKISIKKGLSFGQEWRR
jgi:hypothetical protein